MVVPHGADDLGFSILKIDGIENLVELDSSVSVSLFHSR